MIKIRLKHLLPLVVVITFMYWFLVMVLTDVSFVDLLFGYFKSILVEILFMIGTLLFIGMFAFIKHKMKYKGTR